MYNYIIYLRIADFEGYLKFLEKLYVFSLETIREVVVPEQMRHLYYACSKRAVENARITPLPCSLFSKRPS